MLGREENGEGKDTLIADLKQSSSLSAGARAASFSISSKAFFNVARLDAKLPVLTFIR